MTPAGTTPRVVGTTELPQLFVARVSRTDLALFGGASGDHNPLHIDSDAAREAGFDDVFAPGMLPMAHLGRLLTSCFPPTAVRSFAVRFVAPTPVNVELTCHASVRSVAENDANEVVAAVDLYATLGDGTVAVRGSAVVAVG